MDHVIYCRHKLNTVTLPVSMITLCDLMLPHFNFNLVYK